MDSINPMASVNPSTSITVKKVSREVKEQNLRVDQVVHGTVAEGGEDRALLQLGRRQLWAETNTPLKTGQRLTFQVLATTPRLELRVIQDLVSERLGGILHLLGEHWNIKPALQSLIEDKALFALLSPSAQAALTALLDFQALPSGALQGGILQEFLQRLGLDLEKRLGAGDDPKDLADTLKSALLEVRHQKDGGAGAAGNAADRLLQNLELFQLCQVRLDHQGVWLLPLPLPFLDHGYLMVERDSGGAEETETDSLRFSLHFSLRGLGDLRVEFLHDPQGLFLRFGCDSKEKIAFISPFLEELKQALAGFPLRSVTFSTEVEDPATNLLKKILPEGDVMLDTRV
jgi:hypothetical protein